MEESVKHYLLESLREKCHRFGRKKLEKGEVLKEVQDYLDVTTNTLSEPLRSALLAENPMGNGEVES